MLTPDLFHRHTGGGFDGPKISYNDLKDKPSTSSTLKYCIASKAADQTIPDTTGTMIDFDTFETNDSGMSGTNGRITITEAGLYVIQASIEWDDSNAISVYMASLYENTNQILRDKQNRGVNASSDLRYHQLGFTRVLAVGDYIRVELYHNKGSDHTVNCLADKYTLLSVIKY